MSCPPVDVQPHIRCLLDQLAADMHQMQTKIKTLASYLSEEPSSPQLDHALRQAAADHVGKPVALHSIDDEKSIPLPGSPDNMAVDGNEDNSMAHSSRADFALHSIDDEKKISHPGSPDNMALDGNEDNSMAHSGRANFGLDSSPCTASCNEIPDPSGDIPPYQSPPPGIISPGPSQQWTDEKSQQSLGKDISKPCKRRSCVLEDAESTKSNVEALREKVRYKYPWLFVVRGKSFGKAPIKDRGICSKIVKHPAFESVTLVVIIMNALWIAVDADHNDAALLIDAHWAFQVVENCFCLFFSFELLVRYLSFSRKLACLVDPWFVFDSVLWLLIISETWVVTVVVAIWGGSDGMRLGKVSTMRLLRLLRLSRITRVLRLVPEMGYIVQGLLEATRTVSIIMGMLVLILYAFGILIKELSAGTGMGSKYFDSVLGSMYTLFFAAALLDDIMSVMDEVRQENALCAVLLGVVILFTALTVMNVLLGVVCVVVNAVANDQKERTAVNIVKEKVLSIMDSLDADINAGISKAEFEAVLHEPTAIKALDEVGVDVVALVDYADFIFQSDDKGQTFDKLIDFDSFMEMLLKLREGSNLPVKVRDIIDLKKFIHTDIAERNLVFGQLKYKLKKIKDIQLEMLKSGQQCAGKALLS